MNHKADPREAALKALLQWEKTARPLDEILSRVLEEITQQDPDRSLAYSLVAGAVRWKRFLEEEGVELVTGSWQRLPGPIRWIILMGLYQIRRLERIPSYAVVSSSVDLARRFGHRGTASLVNAVLRRAADSPRPDFESGEDDPARRLARRHSFPDWMVKRWYDRWGKEATGRWLEFSNTQAPLTIRIQPPLNREDALRSLKEAGVEAVLTDRSPSGIILRETGSPAVLEKIIPGKWVVQDEAAQLVTPLLKARPGETILDAAAAPGGKTSHLWAQMKGEGNLTAVDRSAARLGLLKDNLDRLGIKGVETTAMDITHPPSDWEGKFDAVLLDAPCGGLGTIRRHPDIKWTRTLGKIEELAAIQKNLLQVCFPLLKPGGRLLYVTCTTEPEENDQVVTDVADKTGAVIDPILPGEIDPAFLDGPFFKSYPEGEMDGFFAARLLAPASKKSPGKPSFP